MGSRKLRASGLQLQGFQKMKRRLVVLGSVFLTLKGKVSMCYLAPTVLNLGFTLLYT